MRIAAVATTRTAPQPSCSTSARLPGHHGGDLRDLRARDLASLEPLADARELAALDHLAEAAPSTTSATSTRVVLEPMSMQAQSISARAMLP